MRSLFRRLGFWCLMKSGAVGSMEGRAGTPDAPLMLVVYVFHHSQFLPAMLNGIAEGYRRAYGIPEVEVVPEPDPTERVH